MVASISRLQGAHAELSNDVINDTAEASPDLTIGTFQNLTIGTSQNLTIGTSQNLTIGTSHSITTAGFQATHLPIRNPPKETIQTLDILNSTLAPPKVPITLVSTGTTRGSVVTLIVPADREDGSGLHLAVVIVPVALVILAVLLVLLLVFVSRRRRLRGPAYKHRTDRDEEISMDATPMLSNDASGNDNQTTAEPVYAIVDKAKKCPIIDPDKVIATNDLPSTANGFYVVSGGRSVADSEGSVLTTAGSDSSGVNITDSDSPTIKATPPRHEQLSLVGVATTKEDKLSYNKLPEDKEDQKDEEGSKKEALLAVRVADSVIVDPTARTLEEPKCLVEFSAVRGKVPDKGKALTLVECDVYEAADCYDPNRDDEDGTYEIPDSPGTVCVRNSMARFTALQKHTEPSVKDAAGSNSTDEGITIPLKIGPGSSDSDSDLESDFEDLWGKVETGANEPKQAVVKNNRAPPPVPKLLPQEDVDTDYMAPKCHPKCHLHKHSGTNKKTYHEYDPVYVPHSDPAGMAERLDNQNYVQGRQRSDSRQTNMYEEIQFGGSIYDTVDDDDDNIDNNNGAFSENEHPHNQIKLPPRIRHPPSPPPPLVPRRTRPISGFGDIGHQVSSKIKKPLPPRPEEETEPWYSGLILDDVWDPEDSKDHDYTSLAYTKLRSVGSGSLLDGQDDIKAIDDTDSETYAKQPFKQPVAPPHLTPRSSSKTNSGDSEGTKKLTNECVGSNNKTSMLFFNGNGEIFSNGYMVDDDKSSDSSDSDDSYEPFDFAILPPEAANKTPDRKQ